MNYISIKGSEIIKYWNMAKEMINTFPADKTYIDENINKTGIFKATNSIFCKCYFKPNKHNISFRMDKYNGIWNLNEYVGLYGKATEIRYIKPEIEYIIDTDEEDISL
jgi:hypothetical protein